MSEQAKTLVREKFQLHSEILWSCIIILLCMLSVVWETDKFLVQYTQYQLLTLGILNKEFICLIKL